MLWNAGNPKLLTRKPEIVPGVCWNFGFAHCKSFWLFSIPYIQRNRPKGSPLRIWRLNNECGIKDLDLHTNLHFPVFWITPECLAGFGIFWYHWSLFKIFLTIQRGHGWHRRKNHKWQVTAVLHSHTPTCCIAHYSLLLKKFGEEIAHRIFLSR